MAEIDPSPKTIGQIIDNIERIREELLLVQNALEKLEPTKPSRTKKSE